MAASLDGQSILVTGGTRGIGAAIAREVAAHGAAVAVAGRDVDAAEAVVASIAAAGGRAIAVACDATDEQHCREAVRSTVDAFGHLDTVFANQGVGGPPAPVTEWPAAAVAACLEVNLISCLSLASAAQPDLAADGGGRFIVTGSGTGHSNAAGMGMYGISKAAAAHLVKQLALEWRPLHIAVNELVPGPVRTAMTGFDPANPRSEAGQNRFEEFVDGLGEWLKDPEDVAPLARYLATLPTNGPSGQVFSLAGRIT